MPPTCGAWLRIDGFRDPDGPTTGVALSVTLGSSEDPVHPGDQIAVGTADVNTVVVIRVSDVGTAIGTVSGN